MEEQMEETRTEKGNGHDKLVTHIPRDVRQLLALTERQQGVLRLGDAGITPAQFVVIRDLLAAEAEEKAAVVVEKKFAPVQTNPAAGNDGWPTLAIAAIGAVAGFVSGAWLVAAVTPKPPPSLKARIANWLLSDY
jgi:hypothetical protein